MRYAYPTTHGDNGRRTGRQIAITSRQRCERHAENFSRRLERVARKFGVFALPPSAGPFATSRIENGIRRF